MSYNFILFKNEAKKIEEWLIKELHGLRTGRASPLLLDHVMVKSYEARVPLRQVATLSVDDARTLRITPWDRTLIKEIESAIATANLGVSTAPDGASVRVNFPALTTEGRQALQKAIHHKFEAAKVSLRSEREKVWSDIQAKARAGGFGEDDKFRAKDELQAKLEAANQSLEAIAKKKEMEVMS